MTKLSTFQKRAFLGSLALAVLLLITWRVIVHKPADAASRDAAPAIAVDTAAASHSDVPIYLEGLGTVQAFYTVTVTARVDGEIQKIGFTEGQTVHKGDLLAQIDPRPNQAAYEQAVATKAKDAPSWRTPNAISNATFCCNLRIWPANKRSIPQRATVDQLSAQVKVDQAAIDNARTQLDYTRITSPIDGRTGIRLIDPGNIVRAAGTAGIVVVTQVQPISVVFTLPEEEIDTVGGALAAGPVQVTTLSRDGNTVLDQGTLALIDNQIDQTTGTARLKATFPNTRNTLWPGQYVNARVLVRTERNVLTVPSSAVQLGPNGPFTYVVKGDSTVEVRPLGSWRGKRRLDCHHEGHRLE